MTEEHQGDAHNRTRMVLESQALKVEERGHQPRWGVHPWEKEKAEKQIFPYSLQVEHWPNNLLIFIPTSPFADS